MRGEDQVRQACQRVIVGVRRLRRADIQRGDRDAAVADRLREGSFVHESATRDVDQDRAGSNVTERFAADHVLGGRIQVGAGDNSVRLLHDRSEREHLQVRIARIADVGVVGERPIPECPNLSGDLLADPPGADDADGATAKTMDLVVLG